VEAQPAAEALYVEAMRRSVDLAIGFLEKLAKPGDPALAALPCAVAPETGFTYCGRLYYTTLMDLTRQTPVGWFLDMVRSSEQQLQALDRQIGTYLATLIHANSNRIVGDFNDRVLESRRRFQSHIRSMLGEVATSAEGALSRAKECWAQGSQAVQHEVDRIDAMNDRLRALGFTEEHVRP